MMRCLFIPAALLWAWVFSAGSLAAQTETADPNGGNNAAPANPEKTPSDAITLGEVEKQLAALESEKGLEEVVKVPLRKIYEEAITTLESAKSDLGLADSFREALSLAPEETKRLKGDLEGLPAVGKEPDIPHSNVATAEEIKEEIESRRTENAELDKQLNGLEGELTQVGGRPIQTASELPEASARLVEIEAKLASPEVVGASSRQEVAQKTLLRAQKEGLLAEIAKLEQEQLSQKERVDLLEAKHALLKRRIEIGNSVSGTLEKRLAKVMKSEAMDMEARVDILTAAVEGSGARVAEIATETRELADEYQRSVLVLKQTSEAHDEVAAKLSELTTEFLQLGEEAKLGGFEGAAAQILVEQRRKLPNSVSLAYEMEQRQEVMREARLFGFGIGKKVAQQAALEEEFVGSADAVGQLLAVRSELLTKLASGNRRLVRELAELDVTSRNYRNKVIQIRDYLRENLFWARSSPPIGGGTAGDVADTMRWIFGAGRWSEAWRALNRCFARSPIFSSLVLLAALTLLLARTRIINAIAETREHVRRISTDRYVYTLRALLGTALLALPVPLLIGYIGRAIYADPENSDWLRGLSQGFIYASLIIGIAWFLGSACHPRGIGIGHFGWNEKSSVRLRRAIAIFSVVYIPALLITSSTIFEEDSSHFDSVGRFCLNFANVWATIVLWRLLRPSDGILAPMIQEKPDRFSARTCYVWYSVALFSTLSLVVLACLGYVITAVALSLALLASFGFIVLGSFAYYLTLRWFMVKERKLALAEAIAERKARKEAASHPEESADEVIPAEDAEAELDLSDVGRQTRRLLRSLACIGVIVAIWFFWLEYLPLDQLLGTGAVGGGFSLLQLAEAILIAVTFSVVVKNLPGLLELAGMRSSSLDAGTRYAVATISQYVLAAIGIAMFTKALGIDWSNFGWIAAALSVGLGFGLQEIVANFVCGIILLFERPIRVGDVVTIDTVTGTVTRIRMRATTITDWDRKEFVVPNKQFITGTLMNWTLSSPVNRVVIGVGIAYGSDTEKAREILLDVARDHPRILDEPAPLATFELFGDSSLNLNLRCYLPDLDGRIGTITELHTEIDRRFKDAGIEIPFPQRDLHVRGVDPGTAAAFGTGNPK